jgi:hypothetical protein
MVTLLLHKLSEWPPLAKRVRAVLGGEPVFHAVDFFKELIGRLINFDEQKCISPLAGDPQAAPGRNLFELVRRHFAVTFEHHNVLHDHSFPHVIPLSRIFILRHAALIENLIIFDQHTYSFLIMLL